MEAHSSILAWKIPWTGEPGRLQSMGLQGVGHDWAYSTGLFFTTVEHNDYIVRENVRGYFKGL